MDAVVGLLDGVRARGAFVLRMMMDPPWSMSIQDEAPLTLICQTAGSFNPAETLALVAPPFSEPATALASPPLEFDDPNCPWAHTFAAAFSCCLRERGVAPLAAWVTLTLTANSHLDFPASLIPKKRRPAKLAFNSFSAPAN